MSPDREAAWNLLNEFVKNPNLVNHGVAVEAAMRRYARDLGHADDEEKWAITGLIHDFDWEIYPSAPDHAVKGAQILQERGYPADIIRAVVAHAEWSGVPRETPMEHALNAVDELSGFVVAVALVRPSRKLEDVQVRSVRKKMKEKSFAAAVSRDDIIGGAEEIGLELDEHIRRVIEALQQVAGELGL